MLNSREEVAQIKQLNRPNHYRPIRPCIYHGLAAPENCWEALYGGHLKEEGLCCDPASMRATRSDLNRALEILLFELDPDEQGRVLCAASALADNDAGAKRIDDPTHPDHDLLDGLQLLRAIDTAIIFERG